MKTDQKTRKNKVIFQTFEQPQKHQSNPTAARLVEIENDVAILCQKDTRKKVGKKEYSNHFLQLLQNLHETSKKEGLKVVPFSAHITNSGLNALIAESEKRSESLATVLHQRYAKALERRIKRKPVFYFTFGYDNPEKKGDLRVQPKEYSGLHIHGHILATESESDGRTRQGQAFRRAFKTFNGNVQSESFKQQEVSIATASKIEHYETKYTTAGSMQKQADYLAKNARQFTRNFKDNGKPYAASKSLLKRKNERIHETITVEAPKPQKETLKKGGATTAAAPAAQLVLTEQGLVKPPPVSDSLQRKIAEWNKQLTDSPESATVHAPPPPPTESLDDMINNL